VALVDCRLAELLLAVDALKALARRVPVVVMGTGDPALYAASYVAAGASGYWAKDGDLPAVVGLLRAAVVGGPALAVRPSGGAAGDRGSDR
jgi:DNA-binding NarL/FixJ family response regulator